ncbi:alpha/beta hydrolase [Nitrospira sp. Kam-Ns4a]
MAQTIHHLGGLRARLTGGTDGQGGGDGPLVVLLHGFGAPGDDLVPLAPLLEAPAGTRFLFPEGPLALATGLAEARAWWLLDLERLNRDVAAGRARDYTRAVPAGLAPARERLLALLQEAERRLAAPPERTVLGGFSQGAMLACDAALRSDRKLAGLALLSGTLIADEEWRPLMPRRRGLRVFQSHGRSDPILPFFLAEQLRDRLAQAGLVVDWVSFQGAHEIPPVVLARLGAFLRVALGPQRG